MVRILIADDSPAIRFTLKDILEVGGHELVAESENGQEAIDMYLKHSPDMILLDMNMPKKDGLGVVKEIMVKDSNAKIVLISGTDEEEIIRQCLNEGASSFITKPFQVNDVLETIAKIS